MSVNEENNFLQLSCISLVLFIISTAQNLVFDPPHELVFRIEKGQNPLALYNISTKFQPWSFSWDGNVWELILFNTGERLVHYTFMQTTFN